MTERQTDKWLVGSVCRPACTNSFLGWPSLTHSSFILYTIYCYLFINIYFSISILLLLYQYRSIYIYIYLFWVNYYLFINGLCFSFPQIFFEFPAESHGESERPNRSSPNPTQPSLSNNIFDQDVYKY